MTTTYQLSEQQQAVLDFAQYQRGSLNLVARAGCGKTSTLMALAQWLYENGLPGQWDTAFLGAYNRAIAEEIKAKLAANGISNRKVEASTMHGAGFSAWRKVAPQACDNVNDKKCAKLLDASIITDEQRLKVEPYREFILKAVSLAKQRAFGVQDAASLLELAAEDASPELVTVYDGENKVMVSSVTKDEAHDVIDSLTQSGVEGLWYG